MSGLAADERLDRLRLARTDQVGAVTFHALIRRFGSAARALDALPDLSRRGGRLHALKPASRAEAMREIEAGTAAGARLMVFGDSDYPAELAAAEPAPPVLWLHGKAPCSTAPASPLSARGSPRPPVSASPGPSPRTWGRRGW